MEKKRNSMMRLVELLIMIYYVGHVDAAAFQVNDSVSLGEMFPPIERLPNESAIYRQLVEAKENGQRYTAGEITQSGEILQDSKLITEATRTREDGDFSEFYVFSNDAHENKTTLKCVENAMYQIFNDENTYADFQMKMNGLFPQRIDFRGKIYEFKSIDRTCVSSMGDKYHMTYKRLHDGLQNDTLEIRMRARHPTTVWLPEAKQFVDNMFEPDATQISLAYRMTLVSEVVPASNEQLIRGHYSLTEHNEINHPDTDQTAYENTRLRERQYSDEIMNFDIRNHGLSETVEFRTFCREEGYDPKEEVSWKRNYIVHKFLNRHTPDSDSQDVADETSSNAITEKLSLAENELVDSQEIQAVQSSGDVRTDINHVRHQTEKQKTEYVAHLPIGITSNTIAKTLSLAENELVDSQEIQAIQSSGDLRTDINHVENEDSTQQPETLNKSPTKEWNVGYIYGIVICSVVLFICIVIVIIMIVMTAKSSKSTTKTIVPTTEDPLV